MNTKGCVVVDYEIGNVFSVMQALKYIGVNAELTGELDRIRNAERLILPGVGAFGRAADQLRALGLDEAISDFITSDRPFLGICVGMQLLMEQGLEFGEHKGLGYFKGTVEKIDVQNNKNEPLQVPVIGWNKVFEPTESRWESTPFASVDSNNAYYFVHSFSVRPENDNEICALANVGNGEVVAAIKRDNILGVQFHPERSSGGGLNFLKGFLEQ
jgi:glutamine amidotransferase